MNKPKVLLVSDNPGWAFDFRCEALMKHLNSWFDFERVYWGRGMPNIDYSRFDLVYYLGFSMIGSDRDTARNHFKKEQIVTSIPGLDRMAVRKVLPYINKSVACSVLNPIFEKLFRGKSSSKLFLVPNGVDEKLFKPGFHSQNSVFTVGWTGNHPRKFKRFTKLEATIKSISEVNFLTQKKDQSIPHEQMPSFFHKLDCYCCTSTQEGSSNPVLEAAACGIPIISTPVGIAPDMLGSGTDRGIIIKHDLSDLKEAIIRMRDYTSKQRNDIGTNLRDKIVKDHTWKQMAGKYKEMFDFVLTGDK